jgi:hypothetical protein
MQVKRDGGCIGLQRIKKNNSTARRDGAESESPSSVRCTAHLS